MQKKFLSGVMKISSGQIQKLSRDIDVGTQIC